MAEDFNHFPQIAEQLHKAVGEIVRAAAFKIQAGAQQRCPVLTGFTRSSIYVETSDSSTYGSGVSGDGTLLPEEPTPEDDTTAIIGVGSAIGIYLELGTRHMPSRPYVVPAVEEQRSPFETALSRIEDALHA